MRRVARACASSMRSIIGTGRAITSWKYIAPIQVAAWDRRTFEAGTWGGEIRSEFAPLPGEIIAQEHWCSSGFGNTDLDLLLKQHENPSGHHDRVGRATCLDATRALRRRPGIPGHGGADATASYSEDHMHAALDICIPNYASAIVTTREVVEAMGEICG